MENLTECVTNFSSLQGGKVYGELVAVGDHPELFRSRILFVSRAEKNWPSHWHSRYSDGYIEFSNGKRFCLARQTIAGRKVHLFHYNGEVDIKWREQKARETILGYPELCSLDELYIIEELVLESAAPEIRTWKFPSAAKRNIRTYIRALSLRDLEALVVAAKPVAREPAVAAKVS